MTVTFSFGDGQQIVVANDSVISSKFITNAIMDFHTEDITIPVPSQYSSVFNVYIDVIVKLQNPTIDAVDTLLTCFNMETYFSDDVFFHYLMTQVYKIWDKFKQFILLVPDVRMFYLYTPYEFVPNTYLDNPGFFYSWLVLNKNKEVVLNGEQLYHTDVKYYDNGLIKELYVYHTVDGQNTGFGHRETWYENYIDLNASVNHGVNQQLQTRRNYKGDDWDGVQEGWYANGGPEFRYLYTDNMMNGVQETWYRDGKPDTRYMYKNNDRHGVQEDWYEGRTGQTVHQLKSRDNYKNGRRHGLQEGWYDPIRGQDGQINYQPNHQYTFQREYIGNYIDGKEYGLQEGWYINGEIRYREVRG